MVEVRVGMGTGSGVERRYGIGTGPVVDVHAGIGTPLAVEAGRAVNVGADSAEMTGRC